jgi:hypothetical protein
MNEESGLRFDFRFFVAMDTLAYSFFKEITSLKWFLLSLGDMTINCRDIYNEIKVPDQTDRQSQFSPDH